MFQRMMLRRVFERLDTTPGQEKVIVAAVDEARAGMRKAFETLRNSREELARSISGEVFDEGSMGTAFAKQDEAIAEARRAMMNALTKVHEALDAKQRAALADMLAQGPRGWGRFGGPYRT
jgi:Spy/CpxP family protein refolding chaperone